MTPRKFIHRYNPLVRKNGKIKPKAVIRIVTEGEKTEKIYFESVIKKLRITTTKVIVTPSEYGSDPLNIVNFALNVRKDNKRENRINGEPKFDYVFCVFDKDDHTNYFDAFKKGVDNKLCIIRSIPCFEIWLLLHFRYSSRPYDNREELYRELRKEIPSYEKNIDVIDYIWDRHEDAMRNSLRLYQEQAKICDLERQHPNPITEIHVVIDKIINPETPKTMIT